MPRQLPDRPNLEQLKKQAKSLLHAAQAREADALHRFAALPALSSKSIEQIGALDLALHDAQSVIAREHGFPSWTALREEVDARTLSFEAAIDEFLRCATGGAAAPREPATRAPSEHRNGHAADGPGARRRRVGRGAVARPSGARDTTGRTAELGAAALRVPHLHARRPTGPSGRARHDRAAALRPRGQSERGIPLELAPGAAANGAVGRDLCDRAPAARGGAARGRRESDRRCFDAHRGRRPQYRRA